MTPRWPRIGDTIETVKPMEFTTAYYQAGKPMRFKIETDEQAKQAYRLIEQGTWRIVRETNDSEKMRTDKS